MKIDFKWHSPILDKPQENRNIIFFLTNNKTPYAGIYKSQGNSFASNFGGHIYMSRQVDCWCYLDDPRKH